MNDRDNVIVKNGTIRDCYYFGIPAFRTKRCRFENLNILNNGRYSSAYDGIHAGSNTTIKSCIVMGNPSGIVVDSNSRVIDNQIINNTVGGLEITGAGSYVANNIVKGNGDNYDFDSGNHLNILLSEVPESLDWVCSVKFAGTLTCTNNTINGIEVTVDDVTIDMAGHSLIGPGESSGNGIYQGNTLYNLTVLNGNVTNWRGLNKAGVNAAGYNNLITGIKADYNDNAIVIYKCSVMKECLAYNNISYGISVGSYNTIQDCVAYNNDDDGISAGHGNTIRNCTSKGNNNDGIDISSNNRVLDCTFDDNGDSNSGTGAGIHVTSSDNRIDGNNMIDNEHGISVDAIGNFIVRNSASGNYENYVIVASNKVGTIVLVPNSGAISGSAGGAGVGSTDPWSNFSF